MNRSEQACAPPPVGGELAGGARIAGRYTVIETLGSGGMGIVYRVRDDVSHEQVALKQLLAAQAGARRPKVEALFEREYHTLARLKHPCIIEAHDYGVSDAGPYYTMELLDGGDLQAAAPVPWREACRHLCDVASSLALLHAHRLVHRDITPRNVRLTTQGRAKLIDFGALTGFGTAPDVVGTPLCMAPEVLYRAAVDQRTDLFALGVVAYYLLTGRHAFVARGIDDLPDAWKQAVVAPSLLAPEIPAALDQLVCALMSPDPMSRPPHAAQVIDTLCAIGALDVRDYELVADDSFLESARLVGRGAELQRLAECVDDALAQRVTSVVISGGPGIGKTRLLREVGLDAQLRGLLVLQADAQATSGYFGVVAALALDLLDRGGRLAREAFAKHAGVLVQLTPRLRERMREVAPEPLPPNAAEQRARFHASLRAWLMEVAAQRAVLMLVDNLQAADESSAGLLAALCQETSSAQLVVMTALRTNEALRASQPLQVLLDRARQLELGPLGLEACDELVQSLFGDVDNCRRVSKLLFAKSGGNPQHCVELAQLLVRKQLARCVSGTWVLGHLSSDDLPDRLEDAFLSKLANLPPSARALAEALCLHPKPIPIDHCLRLGSEGDEAATHGALDALLCEQILACADGTYRFIHDGLRTLLASRMSGERARELHRRAASLLEHSDDLELRMQRGWHLLRAGEEEAGADLLATTSRTFVYAPTAREESQSVIAALQAALEVYERRGRSAHQRAGLLFPLILLCYYSPDSSLIRRHAPEALRLGMEITCLGFALGLAPRHGRTRALELGLRRAHQRFAREQKRRGLQMTLQQAIAGYCSIVPASLGACGCHYDTTAADELAVFAEPLALFSDAQLPGVMYGWMQAQLCFARGLETDAFHRMQQVLAQLEHPEIVKVLGDAHSRSLRGGALFMLGLASCYRGGQQTLAIAEAMDALGMRLWSMTADQLRLLYHVCRGETERARHYRQRVERSAMLGGPTWHTELFWPAAMLHAEVLCDDRIAVKRTCQHLERVATTVASFAVPASAAKAAYASMRGDHAEAIALYEDVLEKLPPRHSVDWLPHRGHFARALNRAGEHRRAEQLLLETLRHVGDAERETRLLCFEPRRQLAIAQAALGDTDSAQRLLETLVTEHLPDDNPLLLGLLYHSHAELALRAGMLATFEDNLASADAHFRATGNPMLVAQASALRQRAQASTVVASGPRAGFTTLRESPSMLLNTRGGYSLQALSSAPDRPRYALDLLVHCTAARGGHLYWLVDDQLQLVASSEVDAPTRELETRLLREIRRRQRLIEAIDAPDGQTEIFDSQRSAPTNQRSSPAELGAARASLGSKPCAQSASLGQAQDAAYRLAILSSRGAAGSCPVGGLILLLDPANTPEIDMQLLDAVAEALCVSGER